MSKTRDFSTSPAVNNDINTATPIQMGKGVSWPKSAIDTVFEYNNVVVLGC